MSKQMLELADELHTFIAAAPNEYPGHLVELFERAEQALRLSAVSAQSLPPQACPKCQNTGWCHANKVCELSGYPMVGISACPARTEPQAAADSAQPVAFRWKHPNEPRWKFSEANPQYPAYSPDIVEPLYTCPAPSASVREALENIRDYVRHSAMSDAEHIAWLQNIAANALPESPPAPDSDADLPTANDVRGILGPQVAPECDCGGSESTGHLDGCAVLMEEPSAITTEQLTEWVQWLDWDTDLTTADEIRQLRSLLQHIGFCNVPQAAPTLSIDDVPSCGQENDYRRAKSQAAPPREEMPEIPDDDTDFTPDLARKIIAKYRSIIATRASASQDCPIGSSDPTVCSAGCCIRCSDWRDGFNAARSQADSSPQAASIDAEVAVQLVEALNDMEISAYNAAKYRIGRALRLLTSNASSQAESAAVDDGQ